MSCLLRLSKSASRCSKECRSFRLNMCRFGSSTRCIFKSVDLPRAVRLLYRSGLPVQAQALIRVLLEVRIDIELFMRASVADPAAAASKVLVAMMLQKISQQRQSNFIGLSSVRGAPSREKMLEDEQALVREYGKETAEKVRRNGFSGIRAQMGPELARRMV
jgi:hypothetical protein